MRTELVGLAFCWLAATQVHGHEPQDVVIENRVLSARVSPEGAELMSLRAKENGREFLWQGNPEFWSDRAPLMFPVNVRFKGDRYTYRDEKALKPLKRKTI